MPKVENCGPYVCPFPSARDYRRGNRWTCPNCGTEYRLTRRYPPRPWRDWSAPDGHWVLTWRSRFERQQEARRLKRQWLREYQGGAYVVLTKMDPDYDPPSASMNPNAGVPDVREEPK